MSSKRRRLLIPRDDQTFASPLRSRNKSTLPTPTSPKLVRTARGRLLGALLEVLENDSDIDEEAEESKPSRRRRASADLSVLRQQQRQSYVLKLFDRSVDLSQFKEDSPLYPICRAWIANQPKADYASFGKTEEPEVQPEPSADIVELPGPEGPPISRVPSLLPEQLERDKNNINLNYREAPPPSRDHLLNNHIQRWSAIRSSWLQQARQVESRYEATQVVLNKLSLA